MTNKHEGCCGSKKVKRLAQLLMDLAVDQWPTGLDDHVNAYIAGYPICGDLVCGAIEDWLQSNRWEPEVK